MNTQQINGAQMPLVREVIENERKRESELRHCEVPENDPVVQKKVCSYILEHGEEWRRKLTKRNLK